jgi:hypothetical protein
LFAIAVGILCYWLRDYEAAVYSSTLDPSGMQGICGQLQHPDHNSHPLMTCLFMKFNMVGYGMDFDMKFRQTW